MLYISVKTVLLYYFDIIIDICIMQWAVRCCLFVLTNSGVEDVLSCWFKWTVDLLTMQYTHHFGISFLFLETVVYFLPFEVVNY